MELAGTADPEAFEDALEDINEEINSKAENIAHVLQEINSNKNTLAEEIKRLQARKKAFENDYDRLKHYLFSELESANIDKVKTARFTIGIRNNPPKLSVLDESAIPDDFIVTKMSIDKQALMQAIKEGREFDGVSLVTERSLTIK